LILLLSFYFLFPTSERTLVPCASAFTTRVIT
jgi:hypothetical protein